VPKPPRRWGLPIIATLATLLIAAAVTGSTLMLVAKEKDRDSSTKEVEAVDYVRGFMSTYTTLDPSTPTNMPIGSSHRAPATSRRCSKRSERDPDTGRARRATTGSVVEAGVQRWNDNGSADVLVATKISTKSPDGKSTIESGNRWVATTTKEGSSGRSAT